MRKLHWPSVVLMAVCVFGGAFAFDYAGRHYPQPMSGLAPLVMMAWIGLFVWLRVVLFGDPAAAAEHTGDEVVLGKWKWGLIKVGEEDGEDLTEVVSLYADDQGDFTSFGWRGPCTLGELQQAARQIEKDGVNTFFFDNGTFEAEFDPDRGAYFRYTSKPPKREGAD